MSAKDLAAAAILSLALCGSSYAHDPDVAGAPIADSIFSGLVTEQDVALVFSYLRNALDAAVAGREAPPPDALIQRAESIADELKRRGAASARAALDAFEAILRERAKEPPRLPPSSPLQRTRY